MLHCNFYVTQQNMISKPMHVDSRALREMRITIQRFVTCHAHAPHDNPQKGVNPDQTQYNPGFRLDCPEKNSPN